MKNISKKLIPVVLLLTTFLSVACLQSNVRSDDSSSCIKEIPTSSEVQIWILSKVQLI